MNKFIYKKIKILLTTGNFAIKINIHLLQLIILIMFLVKYFFDITNISNKLEDISNSIKRNILLL